MRSTQSYLSVLRLAKKANFIYYDECDGADLTYRKIYLIKKANPLIKVFSLKTGQEYDIQREVRRHVCREFSFKYRTLGSIIHVIWHIKYTQMPLDHAIDFTDKRLMCRSTLPALTNRETHILKLMLKGQCTERISDTLAIDRKTISSHRRNLFRKINVRSTAELFEYLR